ncbi:MAG: DNA repair protein RecN [Limnochordia bacterium]|nr:DNA repair protein RecN [Limnochordia bacterium]MDD2629605.1 DNA repair protein RecN [Limnochordia bacterium]MDD4517800.1 DNA repair protein RecN [Limnochordia bacterium]
MLVELSIRNYAVIESVDLSFGPGMNVLTGETGAGKSVIIGALGLLLGGRASGDLIRTGSESVVVEGFFTLPQSPQLRQILDEYGLSVEHNELIISREVTRTGRNRCRINDRMVNVGVLQTVGSYLVDLCGQHEHQSLLRPQLHTQLVDQFGGAELLSYRKDVARSYQEVRKILSELVTLEQQSKEAARQVDLLQFQISEIEQAQLVPGEEEELQARRQVLANQQTLQEHCYASYRLLYEGEEYRPAVIDLLGETLTHLGEVAETDKRLVETVAMLESAMVEIQEVSGVVRDYLDELQADPAELDEVERRLTDIGRLKRKYGDSVEEILIYCRKMREELTLVSGSEERIAELETLLKQEKQSLRESAQHLTRLRKQAAAVIEDGVAARLTKLNMKDPRFVVQMQPAAGEGSVDCDGSSIGSEGAEKLEFYISTNPGEEPKPLSRIASGGEISRVMLALKLVFAESDPVPTMVFDEIDAGIGGKTAGQVATQLAEVAKFRQVLCITHLPQVASIGEHHFQISKTSTHRATSVEVLPLTESQRVEEIARMLGGADLSEKTRELARELLAIAKSS